jgi:hypothetical protein
MYTSILLIASCESENDSGAPAKSDIFQIAYGAPEKLHPSYMSYYSDNNSSVVAATVNDESINPGILVYNTDFKGNVLWSNRIKANSGNQLSVLQVLKLPAENYLILSKARHENYFLFIQIDKTGNALSSKKIEVDHNLEINDAYINSSGNVVAVGIADKTAIAFEFNPATNLMKWSRQIPLESVGGFAVGSGKFSFVTLVDTFGNLQLLKLDNSGDVILSKKFYTNSSYFTKAGKSLIIGDHLYLTSSFLQSSLIGLLKIDLSGNIKTATRIRNAVFSDVKVYGKELLFSVNIQNAPNLLSVNTNFEVTKHKTIADVTQFEQQQAGMLGLNDNYISCAMKPGDEASAINFIKLDRKNWTTSCDWPAVSLQDDLISAITIYEETTDIASKDILLSLSDFEVQAEPVTLTKTVVCQK